MADSRARRLLTAGCVAALLAVLPAHTARADDGLLGGVGDIVAAAFAIPVGVLQGTMTGPPVIGTIGGALGGAFNTVSLAVRGTFRLLGAAIPLAAKVAPLIPLFL